MVVAWVANSSSRQIASMRSASLADQPRSEVVSEEAHDRRAPRADRIAIACPDRAVAVSDRDDRRLLRHEALNRVGALDLGRDVNEPQLNLLDRRHC